MLLRIPSVLNRNEVELARRMLGAIPFVDGKLSAGQAAQRVKSNLEADRRAVRELEQLNNLVMGKLVQHPVYRSEPQRLQNLPPPH